MPNTLTAPSFVTQAELWDFVTFVTKSNTQYVFETELDIDVTQGTKIDVQNGQGTDKGRALPKGAKPGKATIAIVLTTDQQFADYCALLEEITPKDGKTTSDPFTVVYPTIIAAKIKQFVAETRKWPPIEKGKQKQRVILECVEDAPPKAAAKAGPLSNADDNAKTAALQAQLDLLAKQHDAIIRNGLGADALETNNKQQDAVKAQMPKPPPSITNTKP